MPKLTTHACPPPAPSASRLNETVAVRLSSTERHLYELRCRLLEAFSLSDFFRLSARLLYASIGALHDQAEHYLVRFRFVENRTSIADALVRLSILAINSSAYESSVKRERVETELGFYWVWAISPEPSHVRFGVVKEPSPGASLELALDCKAISLDSLDFAEWLDDHAIGQEWSFGGVVP